VAAAPTPVAPIATNKDLRDIPGAMSSRLPSILVGMSFAVMVPSPARLMPDRMTSRREG